MERQTVVGQIYGYGVSLLAILIMVVSIHGIVSGVFRVVHPSAGLHPGGPMLMWRTHGAGMGDFGRPDVNDRVFGQRIAERRLFGGVRATPVPNASAGPVMGMQSGPMPEDFGAMRTEMRGQMTGDLRFEAVRGLAVAIVMLIVGIVLFRWHWNWLHGSRPLA